MQPGIELMIRGIDGQDAEPRRRGRACTAIGSGRRALRRWPNGRAVLDTEADSIKMTGWSVIIGSVGGSESGPVLTWYRTGTEAMLDLVILGAGSALQWMVAARSGRRALR